jgi:hypothetical protein
MNVCGKINRKEVNETKATGPPSSVTDIIELMNPLMATKRSLTELTTEPMLEVRR